MSRKNKISTPPSILIYHQVNEPGVDNQMFAVSPSNFDRQMAWLAGNVRTMPLPDLLLRLENDENCSGYTAVTFDDGYADNLYNALPILEKHKIHATFFIASGLVGQERGYWGDTIEEIFLTGRELPASLTLPDLDFSMPMRSPEERLKAHDKLWFQLKYHTKQSKILEMITHLLEWASIDEAPATQHKMLTEAELKRLSSSQYALLGGHCVSHTRMSPLDPAEQKNEIELCCSFLEKVAGYKISCLAYPFGGKFDYNESTRKIVLDNSLYGLTGVPGYCSKESLRTDVPRFIVRNWDQPSFKRWFLAGLDDKQQYERNELDKRLSRVRTGSVRLSKGTFSTNKPLAITYINTHCSKGGAAISTGLLTNSLAARGHKTALLVGLGHAQDGPSSGGLFQREVPRLLRYAFKRKGLIDYAYQGSHKLYRHPAFVAADVVHFQNLHGWYFNPWSISGLSHMKPIVWTLRDMQSFTGRCAHAFDCDKWTWQNGCGDCPSLGVYPAVQYDSSERLWRDKQTIYTHSQLWLVAPSHWMLDRIKNSILREHPISYIPNGIDTRNFRPLDKQACRKKYNLPHNALLVGGCANAGLFNNSWKGGAYAFEVLDILTERFKSLYFVNIGSFKNTVTPRTNIIDIAYQNDPKRMAEIYSALDIFLFPTLADTAPLVVREALSCGTPVCAFRTGGVPDVVIDGENGFLVPSKDSSGLAQVCGKILNDPELAKRFGEAGRRKMLAEFDMALMAERYETVYYQAMEMFNRKFYRPYRLQKLLPALHTNALYHLEAAKLRNAPRSTRKRRYLLRFSPVPYLVQVAIAFFAIGAWVTEHLAGSWDKLKKYAGCENNTPVPGSLSPPKSHFRDL